MTQTPLILIPDDLGIHIRYKALFDYEPSDDDISETTKAMGHDPSNITFVHRYEIKEGVEGELGLWRTLWTIRK